MVDVDRLRGSWAHVAAHGDQVPLRFYSRLFVANPEVRELFPISMAAQRDRLVTALGYVVSNVSELEALTPILQQLGREHRKFGAVTEHYGPVGDALLATLADFLGDQWTAELAKDWADAYTLVAGVMAHAAEEAAAHTPPWWEAEVVAHERRTFDIAVLTLRPEPAYDFVAGQSVPVECALRPRVWRYYSPANAPRADGTLELHVRRAPGGRLSSALVDDVRPGDVLRMGAPVGQTLMLQSGPDRDLLLIAGGTGLAPLKALLDQVVQDRRNGGHAGRGTVTLFAGVRTARELYDLDALRELQDQHSWLTVVPAVADDTFHQHESGDVTDVALRLVPDPAAHDVYLCGSEAMVAVARAQLHQAGCPPHQIHYEGFLGLVQQITGGADQRESEQ